VVIDANREKAMFDSIANDKSWAFDGAYMLVKTNQTHDKDNNNVFKAEDYNLVGPDGNVYKFKTYTPDTKILANGLEANTIIAEGGETRHLTGMALGSTLIAADATLLTGTDEWVTIGAELTEKELRVVEEDSVLVAGSSVTLNAGSAITLASGTGAPNYGITTITLGSDDRLTLDGVTAKVEVGQSVTLDNGTVIKNNGGGKVSVENGSLKLGAELDAYGTNGTDGDIKAFTLAAQCVLDTNSVVNVRNLDLVLASNLSVEKGVISTNVTIGNSAGLIFGDVSYLEKGSVLAKGSMLGTSGSADYAFKIEVKGKEIEVKWDNTADVLTVGGEMVAAGKSITLEDGTVISHKADVTDPTLATGDLFIEHGSIKLAEAINAGSGVGATLNEFLIAKDSTLVAGSQLSTTGTTGPDRINLMAGTVINEGNADKTFSGSVTFADQGKNVQFSANTGNGLDTRYYDLKVTDSFTFIFSKYDAASSNLADSIMSQIGANSGQTTFLSINDMRCKALGVSDVDISTKWGAATAIETVNNALQKVSHQRSSLGALQNRLEHTIKNLDTAAENLQAAESRIRDVDMAKEVMEFTRNNILQQASQAMLAQANQQPQSVLQLLR
jgi:flagellin